MPGMKSEAFPKDMHMDMNQIPMLPPSSLDPNVDYDYAPWTHANPHTVFTSSPSTEFGTAWSYSQDDPSMFSSASTGAGRDSPTSSGQPKGKRDSRSAPKASKKSDPKSRGSSTGKPTGSKRKSSSPPAQMHGIPSGGSEEYYQNQLNARFGHTVGVLPLNLDPRVTSEQIKREAWRICKAEALEMSQRRIKLLEHEHGALERETQQLQVNIGIMRDAVMREHMGLEDAVSRAEKLSSSY
ncbi:hypothetical protein B0H67DRAFT_548815 [Lasiosphaeris hirsuta]|uniref:Uncharacterized protein n=1 Tax=Lasiosphaeris hirsuta TaxID=260670 RepID=A0AA40BB49_9PEZI|nr:hypothetical protein B0H67DRAFT_548815 [Lasiosphaeris hirsuta]